MIHAKGHFLTEEQKELKQEIMEKLMSVIPEQLHKHAHIIDDQSATDLILSCIIMFTRDTLASFILGCNTPSDSYKNAIQHLCKIIQEETYYKLLHIQHEEKSNSQNIQ